MTFKQIFDNMCSQKIRIPARFIVVSPKTFKSITARKLMNNCMENPYEVILTDYADYGNSKVCDFLNFVIVFIKGE